MAHLKDSLDLLRAMVRIPSPTFEEAKVLELLDRTFTSWGLDHKVMNGNIVALSKGFNPALPTLALDAHFDTVPPSGDFTRDPYDPGKDPKVIYGLGSNDDGASVAAMTAVFREYRTKNLPFNLALALSCEEERAGQNGAKWLYGPNGPFAGMNLKWVIVGEPTGMKAATSERGLLVLDAVAEGVSGHAARSEGVNALYIAMDDISRLRAHRFGKVSPVMGEVRLNVTQISAGTAHNVIPDKCSFVVDVRPTDVYSNEEILRELQGICRSTLTPRSLHNRASATPQGSALTRTAETLGIETFSSPTTSNWIRTARESIKMGPGESARSHHADEYVLTEEIKDAVEKYSAFIDEFAKHI